MSTNSLKKFPCQLKILPELMVWNSVYLWQVMQDIGSEMDLGENDLPSQGLVIVSFFIPLICLKLAPWLTHRKARSASITLVPEMAAGIEAP
jgi:antibiotic biosynthesis monooxygenase (ABM) superfamily enzyme